MNFNRLDNFFLVGLTLLHISIPTTVVMLKLHTYIITIEKLPFGFGLFPPKFCFTETVKSKTSGLVTGWTNFLLGFEI